MQVNCFANIFHFIMKYQFKNLHLSHTYGLDSRWSYQVFVRVYLSLELFEIARINVHRLPFFDPYFYTWIRPISEIIHRWGWLFLELFFAILGSIVISYMEHPKTSLQTTFLVFLRIFSSYTTSVSGERTLACLATQNLQKTHLPTTNHRCLAS